MDMMRTCTTAFVSVLFLVNAALGDDARREIRFADIPGYRTLKCDLHIHTVFSDGDVWPTIRVEEAWREGLDAIAITDHFEYTPHKQDLPAVDFNRSYEIARDVAAQRNILLIRGGEMTKDTPPGHFNFLFLKDANLVGIPDMYAMTASAAEQKAFIMWNHPGWMGEERGRWGEVQSTFLKRGQLHGIEICNGDEYYADAHREAFERKLTMLGNTDMHAPSPFTTWTPDVHRTITLVFAKEKTFTSLREALDAGRTAVWCCNRVIGREEVLAPLFDECVKVRPSHLTTKNARWVEIENRCELNITLESLSGRSSITLPAGTTTLVRLDPATATRPAAAQYRATNFLVAPGRSLEVNLCGR
jgi:hypothetical protein